MDGLKGFLTRFKHLEPKEPKMVLEVVTAIQEILGISIPPTHITIQKNVAFLQVSPTIKRAIFVKKEALLTVLKRGEHARDVLDVR